MRNVVIALLGTWALVACEHETSAPRAGEGNTRPVVEVVAKVGAQPLGAAELRARMRADALDKDVALERLIEEEALAQEATRFGFTETAESERAIERLMVRAMLKDLEQENTPDSVSEAQLSEDYALHAEKFQIPERRRSWHILVKDTGEAGRARAESILREIRRAGSPREVFDRYADSTSGTSSEIKAEDLPAIPRQAGIEKPYKEALFAAKSEGPLKAVVKTSYGWHAIVLTEILPEERRSPADVEEDSRERLSQKNRLAKLVEIVEALTAEGLVQYDEDGVERLLAMPGLPERAEPAD